MATTGLQLLGFILGVFAWAGMIATCASPEWRKNSVGGTALDQHKRFDGLWVQCEQMPNGNTNCESYNVFFIGLPEVLQTCRALMIAAIGLGFLGILLSVLGMKCTSVGASNHKAKARTALLGGLMLGVAGVLQMGIGTRWILGHGNNQDNSWTCFDPLTAASRRDQKRFCKCDGKEAGFCVIAKPFSLGTMPYYNIMFSICSLLGAMILVYCRNFTQKDRSALSQLQSLSDRLRASPVTVEQKTAYL